MGEDDHLPLASFLSKTLGNGLSMEMIQRRNWIVKNDAGAAIVGRQLGHEACQSDTSVFSFT